MNLKIRKSIKYYSPIGYVKPITESQSVTPPNKKFIDCSLGVNPFGYSNYIYTLNKQNPFKKFNINNYPEYSYLNLKNAIIKYWSNCCKLRKINIEFGTGSIGILLNINRIFIERGTKVLGIGPTFSPYTSDIQLSQGIFKHVLLKEHNNYMFNIENFLPYISPDYSLIYIDNPNNPTGQIIDIEIIEQILAEAEINNICVVIDEAYGDFMDNRNSAINLINDFENLMVVRTFSKGLGLAGLRIGYIITSPYLAQIYSKVNAPFSLNSIGYNMAITSLKDKNFIIDSRQKISNVKQEIISAFQKIKVLETDSNVPIMTLKLPNKDIDLFNLFKANKIITVSGKDFTGLAKNYIRMRVPKNPAGLLKIIRAIENKI